MKLVKMSVGGIVGYVCMGVRFDDNQLDVLRAIAKYGSRRPIKVIQIQSHTGLSDRTIRTHLKALRACKAIAVSQAMRGYPYHIEILEAGRALLDERVS
ncbi:MAG: ArsR family transcriptional regulator [Anaerolineae bacterium]|nr:ArsR family transcriptional regulator [Anaerolineae bacterium]